VPGGFEDFRDDCRNVVAPSSSIPNDSDHNLFAWDAPKDVDRLALELGCGVAQLAHFIERQAREFV
jgi:hypothetical protein